MFRRLAGAVSIFALVLTMGVSGVQASDSHGGGPKHDYVTGSGRVIVESLGVDAKVHVNAQSGPNGEDARGSFYLRQVDVADVRGDVTCLDVSLGTGTAGVPRASAWVGGVITRSDNPALPVGSGFLQYVGDDGRSNVEPGADNVQTYFLPAPPEQCRTGAAPAFQEDRGNFTVHDATTE